MNKESFKQRLYLPNKENGVLPDGIDIMEYFSRQKAQFKEKDKTDLLLQIDHFLMRLHTGDHQPYSQVFEMRSFCSDGIDGGKCHERVKRNNIIALANLYCFILTDGQKREYSKKEVTESNLLCSDSNIALDIIARMADETGSLTIEEVIKHPFHWSEFQKVYFLCRAVDYINAEYEKARGEAKSRILEKYRMGEEVHVTTSDGWINKLRLTRNEIKSINKKQRQISPQNPVTIQEDLIYKKAKPDTTKSQKSKKERKVLVYELASFIRNRYIHFNEDADNVKACFGNYPVGYWKFFSSRFPKLFMHVYTNMKTYICRGDGMGEFETNEFFDRRYWS